jgi:hypothetical protein
MHLVTDVDAQQPFESYNRHGQSETFDRGDPLIQARVIRRVGGRLEPGRFLVDRNPRPRHHSKSSAFWELIGRSWEKHVRIIFGCRLLHAIFQSQGNITVPSFFFFFFATVRSLKSRSVYTQNKLAHKIGGTHRVTPKQRLWSSQPSFWKIYNLIHVRRTARPPSLNPQVNLPPTRLVKTTPQNANVHLYHNLPPGESRRIWTVENGIEISNLSS